MHSTGKGLILQGVTFRAVVAGIIGTAFLAIATPVSDLLVQGTWIAACHLPIGVVFVFVLLVVGINVPLKKLGVSFTNPELIVIYCMMLIPAGIPSLGLSAYLIPILACTSIMPRDNVVKVVSSIRANSAALSSEMMVAAELKERA